MSLDFNQELPKYNKKTWFKSLLLGFLIGIGIIVPGVSGSTIAIIFGLYASMLLAFSNILKDFKNCFKFLLPIVIGLGLGVILGFLFVKMLVEILPFAMIGLFAGLMSGSFPSVKDEIEGMKLNAKYVILLFVGIAIPTTISVTSAIFLNGEVEFIKVAFENTSWWFLLLCVVVGYVMGITQIVPGLSATVVLMALGMFTTLVQSVSLTYWLENPKVFLIYVSLGIGFVLGIMTFSKFLTLLFKKAKSVICSIIVGLSLGSILSMFFNSDTLQIYSSWINNGVNVLDLILAIVLFALSFVASYYLILRERKHKKLIENE